jgi:hypothetical protein
MREFNGGFLVTHETLSQDEPSDAQEAYDRAMGPNSHDDDGFFDEEIQAWQFINNRYEQRDEQERPFEYGPSYSSDPGKF